MKELVRTQAGDNNMGTYTEEVYEDIGVFVRKLTLHTTRAGDIVQYTVAHEPHPVTWLGPFGTYERAVEYLRPANSIYLSPVPGG